MKNKITDRGYSLLELLIVIVIIAILALIALPYYQNAVQSARATEAIMWWSRIRQTASGKFITQSRAENIAKEINESRKLKYYTLQFVCRPFDTTHPCWEAQFDLKTPDQSVQYYLATQQNFKQLVCVPLNDAGDSFCRTQAGQDAGADTQIDNQPGYIIRY